MKRRTALLVVVAAILVFTGFTLANSFGKAPAPASGPQNAEPAPDFTLADLRGKNITLSKLRGKIVFINFWATWCPPCLAEMPSMEKLHQALKNEKDFVLLAVSVDQANKEDVSKFVARNGFTFPILLDQKNDVIAKYGIRGIPTTFIVDRKGNILVRQVGERDWAEKEVIKAIRELIKLT